MNTTTKLLVPLAFALASVSAHAGVFNIDYPSDQLTAVGAANAEHGAMVGIGGTLRIKNSESPVQAKEYEHMVPTREQVLRKVETEPLEFDDTRYFQ